MAPYVLVIENSYVLTPLNVVWMSFNCCLQTFEEFDLFNLIGVICGLAIYNLTIVELQFPVALYKKLLKKKPTLDDLKELMPDVGRSGKEQTIWVYIEHLCHFQAQYRWTACFKRCAFVSSDSRSLQALLDYTEDDLEETFCLNFTVQLSNSVCFILCKTFSC